MLLKTIGKTPTPGALSGEFTINASGDKVYFSRGNLQATYNGVDYNWAFAENQYDYVGNAAGNTTINNQTVGTKVDLFGWTKAGLYNDGIKQYGINTSTTNSDYGSAENDVCCDWGSLIGAGWRTLTRSECTYLFNTRTTDYGSNNRYAAVQVNGKNGILLFPDDFSFWPAGAGDEPTTFNAASSNWNGVNYTVEELNVLQTAGCVFLLAEGYRNGTLVYFAASMGYYWSSSPGATDASCIAFNDSGVYAAYNAKRAYGRSVRLVLPVEN